MTKQEEHRDIAQQARDILNGSHCWYPESFQDWLEYFRGAQTVVERKGLLHEVLHDDRIDDPEAVEFLLHCADRDSYDHIVTGDGRQSISGQTRGKAINVVIMQLLQLDTMGRSLDWIKAVAANLLLLDLIFKVLIQVHEDGLDRPQYNKPVQAFLKACSWGMQFGLDERVDRRKYREHMEGQRTAFYMSAFLWEAHDVVPCLNTSPEIRRVLLKLALGHGMESMETLDAFGQACQDTRDPVRMAMVKHFAAAEQIAGEQAIFGEIEEE